MSSDANADAWNAALDERRANDPYLRRRRLAFTREDLSWALGLLPDVSIIGVHVLHEPMWIEVFVTSPRFEHNSGKYEGERKVETVQWTVPYPGRGRAAFVHDLATEGPRSVPVQEPVVFEPTWMEGWKMAVEWLREQGGEYLADAATEMENRLPEENR